MVNNIYIVVYIVLVSQNVFIEQGLQGTERGHELACKRAAALDAPFPAPLWRLVARVRLLCSRSYDRSTHPSSHSSHRPLLSIQLASGDHLHLHTRPKTRHGPLCATPLRIARCRRGARGTVPTHATSQAGQPAGAGAYREAAPAGAAAPQGPPDRCPATRPSQRAAASLRGCLP